MLPGGEAGHMGLLQQLPFEPTGRRPTGMAAQWLPQHSVQLREPEEKLG